MVRVARRRTTALELAAAAVARRRRLNAREFDEAIKRLWLDVVDARDRAFSLRNECRETDGEYSALWLAAEDLNQAARRVRRVVDNEVR
jgi:hypothetical protein